MLVLWCRLGSVFLCTTLASSSFFLGFPFLAVGLLCFLGPPLRLELPWHSSLFLLVAVFLFVCVCCFVPIYPIGSAVFLDASMVCSVSFSKLFFYRGSASGLGSSFSCFVCLFFLLFWFSVSFQRETHQVLFPRGLLAGRGYWTIAL